MRIPFWQSARARLVLLVLLVAVPAFLLQVIGAWIGLQQNISVGKHDAGQIVERARGNFETLLDTSRSVFTDLVRLNSMRAPDNCTQVFNDLRLAYERLAPDATNVGLSDAQGNIYCAVNPVLGTKNIASQSDFLRATQSLDMAIGDYTPNPATGQPILGVAYPVLTFDGKVQTVIFITYELRWLENWQKEVALPSGTALTLVSPDGDILQRYLNASPTRDRGSALQTQWYVRLQHGQAGLESPDLDGVTRLHMLVPLRLGLYTSAWLHLGYPVAEIYSQAEQTLAWQLTLMGVIFVVGLALAWWGSENLFLRPLTSLMRVVEQVQHGDLGARATSIKAVGELTGLAQSFDRMAESLQQRELAQRKAQIELQESEARFRAMFESSAMGVVILDLKTLAVRYNPVARALLDGIEAPATLGDPHEFISAEYRNAEHKQFAELLNGLRDSYTTDHSYRQPGKEEVWSHVTISAVKDAQGELRYLVAMMEDITQQKKDQQKLRESDARFRAMFENSAVGMGLMNIDRKLFDANPAMCTMLGRTREELIGNTPAMVTYPDDMEESARGYASLLAGEISFYTAQRRYVRKSGETFWAQISQSVVRDANGKPLYMVGLIADIDAQKQAQAKLAEQEAEYRRTLEQRVEERTHALAEANLRLMEEIEQRKRAEEALAAKAAEEAVTAERTRLARDLHDAVTQTLFASSLIAEVLPDLWALNEEEAKKSTEELRQLTRGALAEMRTLLLELRPAALMQSKLGDLLKQLCEALVGRARLPINLMIEGDRFLPPEVQVAFYRIAQESLNNVFKYARATRVDVSLFLTPAGVHLEIYDNGIGFDMSTHKTTSLGMRIMHERAEAVEADLSVASEPGRGVRVDVDWIEKPDMKLSVFKK